MDPKDVGVIADLAKRVETQQREYDAACAAEARAECDLVLAMLKAITPTAFDAIANSTGGKRGTRGREIGGFWLYRSGAGWAWFDPMRGVDVTLGAVLEDVDVGAIFDALRKAFGSELSGRRVERTQEIFAHAQQLTAIATLLRGMGDL